MANIKELIQSIESLDSSFDEKLEALNQMEETLVAMRQQEETAVQDNVDLIVEAIKVMENKVTAQLEVAKSIVPDKGDKGDKGKDGKDGKNGLDGKNGKDGLNGKDGKDGEDGVSVTDAHIDFDGSLVIKLSTGQEINVGEVVAPELQEKIKLVTSGGAGTVLPSQTGNANKYLKTDGTALSWAAGDGTGTVTSVSGTGTVNGLTLTGTVTTTGNLTLGGTLGSIANSQLTNSAITFGSTSQSLGSTVSGISGVTIDNGAVGATTPSTGTFTTLTAQTEVLKGTGENLLTYSQSFTSNWLFASGTFTTNTVTDPIGTTTAATLTMNGATTANFYQNVTVTNGITYTWSIYAKAGTTSTIQLFCYATGNVYQVNCNLSSGTISSTSGTGTSTITSAGNGWYRIAGTATATSAGTGYLQVNIVGNANTCYLWGAQLEVGTTANAFVATTSTSIYGTPNLSFSGVAGLGLQSDGSLYVSPAGTGALQAQKTDSSATGGNARGANAVDWQTVRAANYQIALGANSVIAGGANNNVSSIYGVISGGNNNLIQTIYGTIGGGNSNTVNGNYVNYYSSIVGGQSNTANGWYNFIGAGYTNSGTAQAAVTTQSGTMNATTAVTLSGSNASIKVGQYITGTSIAGDTYVAAISGTSLTLSKNASGSSTSTLSFYTPHGVVVGGGNNQATGSYSFIGGGGDAGTAANRNTASADWSTVCGGIKNVASGIGSFIGGGGTAGGSPLSNTASGVLSTIVGGWNNNANASYSSIVGGQSNLATASYAFVGGGQSNQSNATNSTISGGAFGSARSIVGNQVFPAHNSPISSSAYGISQSALLILGRQTTDATATVLTSDTSAASGTNQVILPNNSAYYFRGEIIAGVTGAGDTKGWYIEGVIKRGAGVGTTALVGTPTVTSLYADVGASTWAVTALADTTNGGLKITVTGQASTTIRWVAQIRTTEMTY